MSQSDSKSVSTEGEVVAGQFGILEGLRGLRLIFGGWALTTRNSILVVPGVYYMYGYN